MIDMQVHFRLSRRFAESEIERRHPPLLAFSPCSQFPERTLERFEADDSGPRKARADLPGELARVRADVQNRSDRQSP